ncbi:MAG: hypothetical protein KKA62_00955 [Nanoarchaeota archaeon]|nr:hypothetical protein [Nanoarchaeota archaeon]MBU1644499.1 hypothetical protein [Nanoarchaeota archaeon]MBU1976503.1 hypothetical protein [Nanoarchaeota archaeon]
MNISKEAAYLYLYSKKLTKINKEMKRLSHKAEKHATKHSKTSNERKKEKHLKRHRQATEDIKSLMKKHNLLLNRIRHHVVNFHDALRKQHHL